MCFTFTKKDTSFIFEIVCHNIIKMIVVQILCSMLQILSVSSIPVIESTGDMQIIYVILITFNTFISLYVIFEVHLLGTLAMLLLKMYL